MKELKFRVPVECQNGHKAFWFWEAGSGVYFAEVRSGGVPKELKCSCPKISGGEGYDRAGPDQQFTGLTDRNGVDVYEGDVIAQRAFVITKKDGTPDKRFDQGKWYYKTVVNFGKQDGNASGYDYEDPGFYGWNINPEELPTLEVIGNLFENPDLLNLSSN